MPQISLYIDETTLRKVEDAAKKQGTSISKWVADQIREKIEPSYPQGFETLFGSIEDETFKETEEPPASADSSRDNL